MHKQMNIDRVEDLRDELTEMMQDSAEINEVLSRSYETPDSYVDEADLEAELGALNEMDMESAGGYLDALPTAPTQTAAGRSMEGPLTN